MHQLETRSKKKSYIRDKIARVRDKSRTSLLKHMLTTQESTRNRNVTESYAINRTTLLKKHAEYSKKKITSGHDMVLAYTQAILHIRMSKNHGQLCQTSLLKRIRHRLTRMNTIGHNTTSKCGSSSVITYSVLLEK